MKAVRSRFGLRAGNLRHPCAKPESRQRGEDVCGQPKVFFRYANGVLFKLENGPDGGAIFMGDKGKITIDRNVCKVEPPELAGPPPGRDAVRPNVGDPHIKNWIDCIKSRERPVADVEIGHRSTTVCHLGNIARWMGRKLHWDPIKEIFPGDDEANGFGPAAAAQALPVARTRVKPGCSFGVCAFC